ncbi:MAG: hypothetical protein VCC67_10920 [Myxococcota bacterium]
MRHRRREGAGDQNVDSLLDTMANVVGILIVLMAVTQLTVNDAMKRIRMWEREEATSLREATQDARTQLAGIGGIDLVRTLELARLRESIRQLHAQPEEVITKDTETLATDLASQRMRARRLTSSIRGREEKLARLEILLSETEARARDETVTIRLPDPRPAPASAAEIKIFCRYGRVFDPRFDQLARELVEVRRNAPPPAIRYFDAYDVGNELLRWRLIETGTQLAARLEWRHNTIGETLAELQSPNAHFRQRLAEHASGSRFLRFYVWEDSFEVYLEARRLAEEANFAAGWRPFPNGRALDFVSGPGSPTPVD